MKKKLERTKEFADQHRGAWRQFSEGDQVMVKGLWAGDTKGLTDTVSKRVSPATYLVRVGEEERYIHADNLRPRSGQADLGIPNRLKPFSGIETNTATAGNKSPDDHDLAQEGDRAATPRPPDPDSSLPSTVTVGPSAPPSDNGVPRPEAPPASPLLPLRTTRPSRPPERYKPYTLRTS